MTNAQRLLLSWAAMMALTLAAVFVGHARGGGGLGWLLIVALLAMTFVKASVLLAEYLDLRRAPAWNKGLRLSLFFLLATLTGLSIVAA
jgi:heme/copper-type cytochrome/quinol oxidase subunit 3